MGSSARVPITVIDFGTDKIRVLHGCCDGEGGAQIVAFAEAPSEGAVIKGAIVDHAKAGKILGSVLDRTENAASVNGNKAKLN